MKDNKIYITIDKKPRNEYFIKTCDIRYFKKRGVVVDINNKQEYVLQQKWQGNFGSIEWRDVEIIEE